jgi:hypothetical protein
MFLKNNYPSIIFCVFLKNKVLSSDADSNHFDASPDPDSDFYLMRNRIRLITLMRNRMDPDTCFQIKAQILEKVLRKAHIPYILACHLQIDADPDPAYHFDAKTDPDFYLMRIRIRVPKTMQIHADSIDITGFQ